MTGFGAEWKSWKIASSKNLLNLSIQDPTPPLDAPEVVGDLKTWLFEGPKSIDWQAELRAWR